MIPIIRNDAGRAKSLRPKQKNDCSVRVLAQAFAPICKHRDYDWAYDLMALLGKRKCNDGVYAKDFERVLSMCDHYYVKFNPKFYWNKSPEVSEVVEIFSIGTYILSLYDHLTLLKNGVLYDIDMAAKDLLSSEVITIYKLSI